MNDSTIDYTGSCYTAPAGAARFPLEKRDVPSSDQLPWLDDGDAKGDIATCRFVISYKMKIRNILVNLISIFIYLL